MTKEPARVRQSDLAFYDPNQGLKTAVIAEAAEKYFERALRNDPDDPLARAQYLEAIETKIRAQAEYVVFRDAVVVPSQKAGIAGPGRGRKGKQENRISGLKPGLPAADPGDVKAHRWRKRFCLKTDDQWKLNEPRVEAAIKDEQHIGLSRIEMDKTPRGTQGTGDDEWFTPDTPDWPIITMVRAVLGEIDLDPATHEQAQKIIQATEYYTKARNGLAHEWRGRVYLNPPYAQPLIADFVSKMVAERRAGRVDAAIMLTHNYTDTAWFHEAAGVADAICFTRGRIPFVDPGGEPAAPTQGQAFFYFGNAVREFIQQFRKIGRVVLRAADDDPDTLDIAAPAPPNAPAAQQQAPPDGDDHLHADDDLDIPAFLDRRAIAGCTR